MGLIKGVSLTPLTVIHVPDGDIFHAIKATDPGYAGFGQAYFSTIHQGAVKSWRRHRRMTLNLIVIGGLIRFVVHDDREESSTRGAIVEYRVGLPDAYSRLTIIPGLWMAFQGIAPGTSLLLNVADIAHDPKEMDRGSESEFPFDWSIR